jgi:hypothetical protein
MKPIYLLVIILQYCLSASVILQFGNQFDTEDVVSTRIREYITKSSPYSVIEIRFNETISPPEGSLIISFGNATYANLVILQEELQKLVLLVFRYNNAEDIEKGSEGYIVRSQQFSNSLIIATNGNGLENDPFQGIFLAFFNRSYLSVPKSSLLGLYYGSYALLEELGFGFLHPLERRRSYRKLI